MFWFFFSLLTDMTYLHPLKYYFITFIYETPLHTFYKENDDFSVPIFCYLYTLQSCNLISDCLWIYFTALLSKTGCTTNMTYEGDKKIITCLMQEVIGLMRCPTVDFSLMLCHLCFPNQMTFPCGYETGVGVGKTGSMVKQEKYYFSHYPMI